MFNTSLQMSLNCPSHLSVSVTRQRNVCKRRLNPVLAVPPSSVILHTDESGEFPESRNSSSSSNASLSSCAGSLLCHPNTVGIMGGGSVDSTLSFVRKLVHWSKENEETCTPFVLCSDPVLNRELLSLERNSSTLCSRNARSQFDHSPIVENLLSKRVFLEKSGAQCIVVPCHISHSWHDEVFKGCSIPSLHMAECVSRELKEAKLKPLEAGSPLRIGVLATDVTLKAGFYQEKLQNEGFEVVLPDKATIEHTVIPAIDAINRKDMEGARNLLRIALQVLLVREVNTVILASNDMCDLLPRDDPLLKKCIDPMDALVMSTIKWAQQAVKEADLLKRKEPIIFNICSFENPDINPLGILMPSSVSQGHSKMDSGMIGSLILSILKADPRTSVSCIIASIRSQLRYTSSYHKAWIAKQKALEKMHSG